MKALQEEHGWTLRQITAQGAAKISGGPPLRPILRLVLSVRYWLVRAGLMALLIGVAVALGTWAWLLLFPLVVIVYWQLRQQHAFASYMKDAEDHPPPDDLTEEQVPEPD